MELSFFLFCKLDGIILKVEVIWISYVHMLHTICCQSKDVMTDDVQTSRDGIATCVDNVFWGCQKWVSFPILIFKEDQPEWPQFWEGLFMSECFSSHVLKNYKPRAKISSWIFWKLSRRDAYIYISFQFILENVFLSSSLSLCRALFIQSLQWRRHLESRELQSSYKDWEADEIFG